MMKTIFTLVLGVFFCFFAFCNFVSAQEKILTASEVAKLFSGKTFKVVEAKIDKATGKEVSYYVHASSNGVIQIVNEEDPAIGDPRLWSVKEDGSFCYSRRLYAKKGGRNCGYIVPRGSGVYEMYQLRGRYYPHRKIVGAKGSTLIFTFSDFK